MGGKLPTLQAPRFVIVNYLGGTVFMEGRGRKCQRLVFQKIDAKQITLVG